MAVGWRRCSPRPQWSAALQREVGPALVGLDGTDCFFGPTLGFLPELNAAYSVHELAIYDPIIPSGYFSAWTGLTGQPGGIPRLALFCPSVTSVMQARLFGVQYDLAGPDTPPPVGGIFTMRLGKGLDAETLYRFPHSSPATLLSASPDGHPPGAGAEGAGMAMQSPNPSTYVVHTDSTTPSILRLRLTDVPGWRAHH